MFAVARSCAPRLLDNGDCFGFIEASEVEEVRILVEFVEDGAGAVFDVGSREDGDAVGWQRGGEGGAAVEVFE